MIGGVQGAPESSLPATAAARTFDFESGALDGWTVEQGEWRIEEVAGAPSGRRALVQHAVANAFDDLTISTVVR